MLATFELFGTAHIAVLVGTVALAGGLPILTRRGRAAGATRAIAIALAAVLVANEVLRSSLGFRGGGWGGLVRSYLPLHICGLASLLTALALTMRRQLVFEVAFYWGLIGTVQALLTPDVESGPESLWFWQFFVRHCGIVIGVLFAYLAMGMTPRRRSGWRVFGITLGWLVIVACVNLAVGSNYMYLASAPEVASPLAQLPWPWYIVLAVALLGVGFAILQWIVNSRRRS